MSDVDPIVAELRQRRRAAGLNQDTVAGKIGISPAHLSTLERGGQSPALRILRPWTDVLGAKLSLEPPVDAAVAGRRYVLGYIRDIETENASLKAQLGQDEAALRMRAAELERDLDAAAGQVRTLTRRLEAAERRVERAEAARRRAGRGGAGAVRPGCAGPPAGHHPRRHRPGPASHRRQEPAPPPARRQHRGGAGMSHWSEQAACRDNPETMYRDDPGRVTAAKAVCAGCPVVAQCLTRAVRAREPWGVWGGLTVAERERLRDGHTPMRCVRCGLWCVPAGQRPVCSECAPPRAPNFIRHGAVNLAEHRQLITSCTVAGWPASDIAALIGTQPSSVSGAQRRWNLHPAGRQGGRPSKLCGTLAAARRHYRRGERPCAACKRAEARRHHDRAALAGVA